MIEANLQDLADVFANILGNKEFSVKVNRDLDPSNEKVQGVMYPTRRPFMVDGINAETIELGFEFYVSVDTEEENADNLKKLNRITGHKHGSFNSNDGTWYYHSFLDFSRPLTPPNIDDAIFKQMLFLNGTCYISSNDGGLKISNDIITFLTIDGSRARVFLQSGTTNNVRDTDAPTKANAQESSAKNKTQGVSRNYNIFSLHDDVCQKIEKYIEVYEAKDINLPVTVERFYPDFSVTKTCVITNGIIVEDAGSPLILQITLQTK